MVTELHNNYVYCDGNLVFGSKVHILIGSHGSSFEDPDMIWIFSYSLDLCKFSLYNSFATVFANMINV